MCNCNQSNDTFALQESSVRVTGEYNQQVADAWEVIQVNLSSCCYQSPKSPEFQTVSFAKGVSTVRRIGGLWMLAVSKNASNFHSFKAIHADAATTTLT